MTFRPLVFAASFALVFTACGSATTETETAPLTPSQYDTPFVVNTINLSACPDSTSNSVECGTLEVPFDYNDPDIGSFVLAIKKRNANDKSKRIGSMMVNPGGPGFGGTSLADDAQYYFSE